MVELPHTEAAMAAGVLSEWRTTLVARETACLSRADRAAVDRQLCAAEPDGSYPFEGWGDRRLAAETQRLVIAHDPHALVTRRARAAADRTVTIRPAPDTMARISVLVPAAQGVAVWATLSAHADRQRAAGDPRTRGQVLADTLVERVTGQATADRVPITLDLVVSDQTLLAGGTEPAWLQDYGPVPADRLTDACPPEAFTALRRLYARPATGALVAMDSVARRFPAGLARLIRLRDRTCRTAWCDAPVRHTDHTRDHARGGETSARSGQGLCEQCNHTKQAPGWLATPITGPPDALHTVQTVLPTGHTVRTTAPAAPTPSRQRRTTVVVHLHHSPIRVEWAA